MKQFNNYLSLATANNRFNSFSIKTRKGRRWLGKLALAFVLSLSLLAHSMAFNAQPVEATWMNTNWQYRKTHTVNSATGAGTNYQVRVTVYYGAGTDSGENVYLNSRSRTDFGDIRFTDDDKVTLLDYWLESKVDSNNAVFWVEVADDLSSTNRDIYIYYGNLSATTTSNGPNTFIAFENFATDPGVACTDYNANGFAEICRFGFTFPSATAYRIWEKYKVEARWTSPSAFGVGPLHVSRVGGTPYPNFYHGGCNDTDCTSAANLPAVRANGGAWYTVTVGTTYDRLFIRNGTSLNLYMDGVLRSSSTWGDTTAHEDYTIQLYDGGGRAGYVQYDGTNQRLRIYDYRTDTSNYIDYWIDDVRLGKYVDPEPSHGAWGAEEEVAELVLLLIPLALMLPMLVRRLRKRFSFSQVGRA